jgi:hypothetical protein
MLVITQDSTGMMLYQNAKKSTDGGICNSPRPSALTTEFFVAEDNYTTHCCTLPCTTFLITVKHLPKNRIPAHEVKVKVSAFCTATPTERSLTSTA